MMPQDTSSRNIDSLAALTDARIHSILERNKSPRYTDYSATEREIIHQTLQQGIGIILNDAILQTLVF